MNRFKNIFSRRNNLAILPPHNLTGTITQDVLNAIGTCYDMLCQKLNELVRKRRACTFSRTDIEKDLWCHFLNQRLGDFGNGIPNTITNVFSMVLTDSSPWYRKLDLIEHVIDVILDYLAKRSDPDIEQYLTDFERDINFQFDRLDYGYRIVSHLVVDVTSDSEKQEIETAVLGSDDNVATHLQNALRLYSQRPNPDYRDSIKESISAVEAYCNTLTGKNTLSEALKAFKKVNIDIPPRLYNTFMLLYGEYASSDQTGVRHGMNQSADESIPTSAEAYFMLVTCSAFVNYLKRKQA